MEKDLEQLSKYENWFYTSIRCDYIRALWKSDFDILIPIYEKWTNTKPRINTSCGKCVLDFIKRLGKLYYKNKEEYMKIEDGKNTEQRSKGQSEVCSRINSKRKQSKNSTGKSNGKV